MKRFVLRQMDELNKQILAYKQDKTTPPPHKWPDDNMTVAKVKNAFTTFCEKQNNPLNKAYALLCAQPSPTAQSDDSASPVGHDVVLKEVLDYKRKDSLIHVIWELLLRTFYPISTAKQAETKKALSSIKTLMMYFTPESQNTGWQVVEDAKHIKSARFQEERLRLARVLVVAEVTQKLQESPGVNVEDCVTQVMNQRLDQSPSGNTTASPDDVFSTKLKASQASIAQTVTSIQPSLPKCAPFAQHIEKPAQHMKRVANLVAVLHPNKPPANRR